MSPPLLLASSSTLRHALLAAAGLKVSPVAPRIDEAAITAALLSEGEAPRDIADALAEQKAAKVARRNPGAVVIGSDQVLDHNGMPLGKPASLAGARAQLVALRGQTHRLQTAVVVFHDAAPVWRHLSTVTLTMRAFSDAYLDAYLARSGDALLHTVGGYLLEAEGIRLFSRIDGDHFAALGLPLVPLLDYLALRGWIDG